jgi:hypothetical protein
MKIFKKYNLVLENLVQEYFKIRKYAHFYGISGLVNFIEKILSGQMMPVIWCGGHGINFPIDNLPPFIIISGKIISICEIITLKFRDAHT